MNRLFLLPCFVIFSGYSFAQQDWLAASKQKFPGADAVMLESRQNLKITLKQNVPVVECSDTIVIGFMSNQVSRARTFQVYHYYASHVEDLNVYTEIWTNNKPEKIKVDKFERRSNLNRNIFYDDMEEISFTFPAVSEGVKSYVTYNEKIRDPYYIPPYSFGSHLPVAKSVYSVTFPSTVKIRYHLFNVDSSKVQFTSATVGKNNIYSWQLEDIKEIHSEEDGADEAYYEPHIVVTIDEVDGEKFLSDYNQLAKWCSSYVQGINKQPGAEMQAIVTDITAGAASPTDKCRKIYQWVQQNINYVAFEDSINGFRPREGADVCHKRYGDCKDMSSLLYSMCRNAGIKAYYAWIGTSDKPYNHYDIASPILYDHMICIAELDGKKIILDGTGKFSPFDYPTGFIQNKEAMYIDDDGKPVIYKLPVMEAAQNFRSDSVYLVLDDTATLSGSLKSTLAGYEKSDYLYAVKYHETPTIRKSIFQMGNNKFRVDSLIEKGLEDNDVKGEVTIKFSLPDYVVQVGEKISVNLNLNKKKPEQKVANASRIIPKAMDYKHTDLLFVKFKIPDNYEVDYTPAETSYSDSLISYHLLYTADKNYITYTSQVAINSIFLSADKFSAWNKALSKLERAVSENVVLRRTKN